MDFLKTFKSAYSVSTSLVAVRSADPASTIRTIITDKELSKVPILYWDVVKGISGLNESGKSVAKTLFPAGANTKMVGIRPSEALAMFEKVAPESLIFFSNAHMFWKDEVVRQGIWNLRDILKAKGATLILQVTAGAVLPPELVNDVFTLDEPLPSRQELETTVAAICKAAGVPQPSKKEVDKATEALVGLAAFPAEQTLAMSITPKGIIYDQLWEQKRKAIEQTRGLSVWRGGDKFKDIGGCENAKRFFSGYLNGPEPAALVIFMDEIEKMFAGAGTDTSGVTTRLLAKFLTWMEDRKAHGNLFIGPPGSGKTMMGRAIGNEGGVLTIGMDMGTMQSSLVGSSEENFSTGLKVADAASGGLPILVVGTCNSIGTLPPEVRRRFSQGTFFFDLPTAEEQETIWPKYLEQYKIPKQPLPECKNWTGAEIRNCCAIAYRLQLKLEKAAEFIVPVAVSAKEQIDNLRLLATDKYISAGKPGLYKADDLGEVSKPEYARVIRFDPTAVGSA